MTARQHNLEIGYDVYNKIILCIVYITKIVTDMAGRSKYMKMSDLGLQFDYIYCTAGFLIML